MNRKMATYFRFGPVVALLAILAVAFALLPVGPASATDDRVPTAAASPTSAGDLAEYTFTFETNSALTANLAEIRITFDKDTVVPKGISRSAVLVSANSLSGQVGTNCAATDGAGQPVQLTFDPSYDTDTADPNRVVVKMKVPDMNTGTAEGCAGGQGTQSIAANAHVTVVFTTSAGIKNESEKATSRFIIQAAIAAGGDNVAQSATAADLLEGGTAFAVQSKIVLSAVDGARGTVVTITGQGFNDKTGITVWLDNPGGISNNTLDAGEIKLAEGVTVGADDRFTATFTVSNPPFVPGKKNTIAVVDGEGRKADGTLPTFELKGQVTVSPTTAALGDTITVQFKDFDTSSNVSSSSALTGTVTGTSTTYTYTAVPSIKLGGVAVTIPSSTLTDANGEVTFTTTVPNGVSLGSQTLQVAKVCCLKGGGLESTRSTVMTITGAIITLTPTTAVPNQTITVIGRGYTDGGSSKINVANDSSLVSIGGSTSGLKAAGANSTASTNINYGKTSNTIEVDNGGNWSASLILPITSTTTTAGTHELKVIDAVSTTSGRAGVISLVISPRTLKLDPPSGRSGTTLKITGSGFPADNNNSPTSVPSVTITYDGGANATTRVNATPDSSGNFTALMTIPINANIPSTNTVKAEFNYTEPGSATASTVTTTLTHDVPTSILTVTPSSGPPGTTLKIAGTGYKTYSNLTTLEIGGSDIIPSPRPTTGDTGNFSVTALVPSLNTGAHTVVAKVGTTTASAPFTVTETPAAPAAPPPAVSVGPAAALAPLGANLVRVWGYNAATQRFQLYDPAAPLLSDLKELMRGEGYWINVKATQTATLGTSSYSFSAGWNLKGWLG